MHDAMFMSPARDSYNLRSTLPPPPTRGVVLFRATEIHRRVRVHQSPHCTFAFPGERMEAELHCPVACPFGCQLFPSPSRVPVPDRPTLLQTILAHREPRSLGLFHSTTFSSNSCQYQNIIQLQTSGDPWRSTSLLQLKSIKSMRNIGV